ncbi:MAG TPA: helix-turn-helix domain-containing protein [Gemmatimonadaceae bacterium]|jgi:AraC-like DNA-binding protein|nr:helix-turn-helix domain-containing protein [Gemmatimonadaceae bacterium]
MKSTISATSRPIVLAAIRDGEWRSHVRSTLDACGILTFVDDARDLSAAARQRMPDVALWHLDGLVDSIEVYAAAFRDFRLVAPRSAVVAYGHVGRATAHLLFVAGRAGADRVLLRGFDDLERGINEALQSTRIESAIRRTLERCDVPAGSAAAAFEHCLRTTSAGPISVQNLSAALHVNRKTISTWLRRAELPPPERLISWCRVYWVAHLLHDERRSVADVARTLRFSSESDLRRMVARHAHCTPSRLRGSDGADVVLAAFPHAGAPSDVPAPHRSTGTPH